MRLAVLSDIHGNIEAFTAVIANLEEKKPDNVICLGDLVGYGPNPEEVVQEIVALGYDCILGNHETALLKEEGRRKMNFQARENNISTEKLLSQESLNYLRRLPPSISIHDALFVHGFPPDSVYKYVYSQTATAIMNLFDISEQTYFFVGHTHALLLISQEEGHIKKSRLKIGNNYLEDGQKYLINVGSVGQPRDGDSRAKYVIWNTEEKKVEVVSVEYDLETTIEKIHDLGFPEAYGIRLR